MHLQLCAGALDSLIHDMFTVGGNKIPSVVFLIGSPSWLFSFRLHLFLYLFVSRKFMLLCQSFQLHLLPFDLCHGSLHGCTERKHIYCFARTQFVEPRPYPTSCAHAVSSVSAWLTIRMRVFPTGFSKGLFSTGFSCVL
jgi:hypothetical protein